MIDIVVRGLEEFPDFQNVHYHQQMRKRTATIARNWLYKETLFEVAKQSITKEI